tara:strand:+ start:367 stop:1353 length:987 start_codon:yes stop_codon:yes gene_type:complete
MDIETFRIKEIDEGEWKKYWNQISHTNLMQSWEYGQAKSIHGWKSLNLLIQNSSLGSISIAQILVKKIFILGEVARLNRGPLIINSDRKTSDTDLKSIIIKKLKVVAKRRKWRLFLITPEILNNIDEKNIIDKHSLRIKKNSTQWASSRVCLGRSEEELLLSLKGKWRNLLRKSHKSDLLISRPIIESNSIDRMANFYDRQKDKLGFKGISSSFLKMMAEKSNEDWIFCYYEARKKTSNDICGILVSIIHGDTATYVIGNTDNCGRKLNANYAMLWRAAIDAMTENCKWFDLGGINKNTPKGIAHFKAGMNGENYELVGNIHSLPMFE